MTFTVNISTFQAITEQNFDLKLDHVSKYGKLFCIFPLRVHFTIFFLVLDTAKTLLPKEKNSVPLFRHMVVSFPVLKLCVKAILAVLSSVTSMDTSHFPVCYHDRHRSKISVACKGIQACLSTFTTFPSGFEKVCIWEKSRGHNSIS